MTDLFFDNHKQTFWQNLPHSPIQIFELTPHCVGDYPNVFVAISQQGMSICLSYFIQKADWLDFNELTQEKIKRQDYLWEQNCLECFFELNDSLGYLEVNIAPNGNFSAYRFDEYRTPNTMPPMRDDKLFIYQAYNNHLNDWHTRHIGIKFNEHFMELLKSRQPCKITKLHPTVILYKNNEPIYYAIKHASPPDFHNKAYWTAFESVDGWDKILGRS